jgi:hypothetical protein
VGDEVTQQPYTPSSRSWNTFSSRIGEISNMSGSRNQFIILAVIGVIGVALYFSNGHSEDEHGGEIELAICC